MWLLNFVLNYGNESNRERLLGGFGWTAEQAQEAIALLTKEEMDLAQAIFDMLDEKLWPLVAEKEMRKTGLAPEKIAAAAIETPHGVYRGGYFPAVYDQDASHGDIGERQEAATIAGLFGPAYVRASTAKSHTHGRAKWGINWASICIVSCL
jgi:hypothetical protein